MDTEEVDMVDSNKITQEEVIKVAEVEPTIKVVEMMTLKLYS